MNMKGALFYEKTQIGQYMDMGKLHHYMVSHLIIYQESGRIMFKFSTISYNQEKLIIEHLRGE